MDVMRGFGIPVPKTGMATSVAEATTLYKELIGEGNDCVIKAMVLTGGRGLGHFSNGFKGGVHLCSKPGDVEKFASQMLGNQLITKQTGPAGLPCTKIMLAERMYMRREMYISIMLDRAAGGPIFIASPAGGTSIEDVAAATPELIFKQPIDITIGVTDENSTFLATSLGFLPGSKAHAECKGVVEKIYEMFIKHDCTLVEVNPLAETPDHRVLVCDGKINFDDNAEFRQKSIFQFRDRSQEDWREVEAAKHDLNYIGLSGNIGCMVNGAGLAMATMDIIKVRGYMYAFMILDEPEEYIYPQQVEDNCHPPYPLLPCCVCHQLKGGDPANFLDVGGGASESQVQKAFELLNSDNQVKTILVNIFGGIMRYSVSDYCCCYDMISECN
jgi:succinyl-CoA synthetase beta subunit